MTTRDLIEQEQKYGLLFLCRKGSMLSTWKAWRYYKRESWCVSLSPKKMVTTQITLGTYWLNPNLTRPERTVPDPTGNNFCSDVTKFDWRFLKAESFVNWFRKKQIPQFEISFDISKSKCWNQFWEISRWLCPNNLLKTLIQNTKSLLSQKNYQFLYLKAQLLKNYLNSMIRFWKITYRTYKGPNIPSVTFVCFERLWSHEKMTPVVPCFFLTFITLRLCDPQDFTIAGRFPVLLLYMSCVCVQHLFTKIQGFIYGFTWKVNKQKYYLLTGTIHIPVE